MNISPNIYAGPDALTPCAGVGASCLAHDLAPALDPGLPSLTSFAVESPSPRLTAPIRGKTRLFALDRAKNFSGVTAPPSAVAQVKPQPLRKRSLPFAPTRTYLRDLHQLAPKKICADPFVLSVFSVPPWCDQV